VPPPQVLVVPVQPVLVVAVPVPVQPVPVVQEPPAPFSFKGPNGRILPVVKNAMAHCSEKGLSVNETHMVLTDVVPMFVGEPRDKVGKTTIRETVMALGEVAAVQAVMAAKEVVDKGDLLHLSHDGTSLYKDGYMDGWAVTQPAPAGSNAKPSALLLSYDRVSSTSNEASASSFLAGLDNGLDLYQELVQQGDLPPPSSNFDRKAFLAHVGAITSDHAALGTANIVDTIAKEFRPECSTLPPELQEGFKILQIGCSLHKMALQRKAMAEVMKKSERLDSDTLKLLASVASSSDAEPTGTGSDTTR
jgi:hypothetical protein